MLGAGRRKTCFSIWAICGNESGEAHTFCLERYPVVCSVVFAWRPYPFFLKVQDGCDYYCSYCTIPLPAAAAATEASHLWWNRPSGSRRRKGDCIDRGKYRRFRKVDGETFFDLVKAWTMWKALNVIAYLPLNLTC